MWKELECVEVEGSVLGSVYKDVFGSRGYSPCRLAGYENTLLGYKTRLYKLLKGHLDAIDVIMFGEI